MVIGIRRSCRLSDIVCFNVVFNNSVTFDFSSISAISRLSIPNTASKNAHRTTAVYIPSTMYYIGHNGPFKLEQIM